MSPVAPEMQLLADWKGEKANKDDKPGITALEYSLEAALWWGWMSKHGWFGWGWFAEHPHSITHVPTEGCRPSQKVSKTFWCSFPHDCRCHCICQPSWISSMTIPGHWGALGHFFSSGHWTWRLKTWVQFLCDWDEGAGVSILRDLQSSTRQSPEQTHLIFEVGPAWSMGLDQRPPAVPPHLNKSVIAVMVWDKTHLSGLHLWKSPS